MHYNPSEYQQLEALIPALNQGMPGSTALSLYGNVNSEAQSRIAQQQTANQQMMAAITGAAQQDAQGGMSSQGLDSLIGSFQSQYPRLAKPKFQGALDSLSQSLYPDGATQSPIYQPPQTTGTNLSALNPDEKAAVFQQAMKLASPTPADTNNAAQPGLDLHTARMIIVGQMRQQGYAEPAIAEAYDAVGAAYQAVGGQINAPLTYQQDQVQQTQQQQQPGVGDPGFIGGSLDLKNYPGSTVAPEWSAGLNALQPPPGTGFYNPMRAGSH